MYRLEGDRRFAERAEKEMLTVAAFPDWNPKHFLDTAEMTNALGIGYDWLYGVLSPESRRIVRQAIIEKGLNPGLAVYRKGGWWASCHHNWNQVCNGGLSVGALAIANEEPSTAAEVLAFARKSIPLAMASLAPDGGWAEGPGYWHYAMRYTAYYWAALNTALGTDFGLQSSPGFADTGLFRIQFIGPTARSFNYADGGSTVGSAAEMMYFARMFNRPVYAAHERTMDSGSDVFDLLWYEPRGTWEDISSLPLDAWFKGINVVFMRSAWNDPNAMFVGFKGGDNQANHSHLDLGSFVLDALGERWAIDLGADDYNMPGYFGNMRWTYYRLKTEGQNALVLNGRSQDPKAKAPIIAFGSSPVRSFAVADLSAGYAASTRRVLRGVAMLNRKQVIIQDEIEADSANNVQWFMHTPAQVMTNGGEATLKLNGRALSMRVVEPKDTGGLAEPVKLEPPQKPLKGITRLILECKTKPPHTRLVVLFSDGSGGNAAAIPISPLDRWSDLH
jgi:hypothetical protein